MDISQDKAIELLKHGKIGVLPTDTVYGIHGLALKKDVVDRIYEVRDRNPQKPFIILIGSISQLEEFGIILTDKMKRILAHVWPNKVSVILPCPREEFEYLHRGTQTLAFRLPKDQKLQKLLLETGPLISTSVNPQGDKPATTISESKNYFGDKLDFYVDAGTIISQPSTLIKVEDTGVQILRQGDVHIDTTQLQ